MKIFANIVAFLALTFTASIIGALAACGLLTLLQIA